MQATVLPTASLPNIAHLRSERHSQVSFVVCQCIAGCILASISAEHSGYGRYPACNGFVQGLQRIDFSGRAKQHIAGEGHTPPTRDGTVFFLCLYSIIHFNTLKPVLGD